MAKAGDHVGPYVLEARLGGHEPGEGWSARTPEGEPVTVVLYPHGSRAPEEGQRVFDERLAAARAARHDGLSAVLDGGEHDGARYVVTERASGITLAHLLEIAAHRMFWPSLGAAAFITHELARTLAYVHGLRDPSGPRRALVHRRINPDNIVLDDTGRVRLGPLTSDLEDQALIATAARDHSRALAYLSPELIANVGVDDRSDVFALGSVLFELLARRAPFLRATDLETLDAVRRADVPSLPAQIPAELQVWVVRCLEKRTDARPTAREVEQAFAETLMSLPSARAARVGELVRRVVDEAGSGPISLPEGPPSRRPTVSVTISEPLVIPRELRSASDTGVEMDALDDTAPTVAPSEAHPPAPWPRVEAPSDPFYDARRDHPTWEGKRFEVLEKLGSGGMGEVYRVLDRELDEVVAMKLIPRSSTTELRSTERLKREVRLARKISSPHVCRIYDIVDLGDGGRGLTMAFVEGTTLSELMRTGVPVDYARFARWGGDIAEGLAAAHEISIVHRDLKPENVIIRPDDRAVILDFGIALSAEVNDQSVKLTQQGMIMGTPLYMSPEQLCNVPLDGRSDLFALGLILAELITGEVPMRGGSYAELVEKRVTRVVLYQVNDIDPGAPRPLTGAIDELLRTEVTQRPGDARAVALRLRGIAEALSSEPIAPPAPMVLAASPPADPPRAPERPRSRELEPPRAIPDLSSPLERRWFGATTIGLLGATVALIAVSAMFGRSPARRGAGSEDRGGAARLEAPPPRPITAVPVIATATSATEARIEARTEAQVEVQTDAGPPRRESASRARDLPPAEEM